MFIVSVVKFDDGKQSCVIISGVKAGEADKAHSTHQQSEAAMWRGWKRVVGGQYQAFEGMIEAWIAASKFD